MKCKFLWVAWENVVKLYTIGCSRSELLFIDRDEIQVAVEFDDMMKSNINESTDQLVHNYVSTTSFAVLE